MEAPTIAAHCFPMPMPRRDREEKEDGSLSGPPSWATASTKRSCRSAVQRSLGLGSAVNTRLGPPGPPPALERGAPSPGAGPSGRWWIRPGGNISSSVPSAALLNNRKWSDRAFYSFLPKSEGSNTRKKSLGFLSPLSCLFLLLCCHCHFPLAATLSLSAPSWIVSSGGCGWKARIRPPPMVRDNY